MYMTTGRVVGRSVFVIGDCHFEVIDSWNDLSRPIGLDHHRAHCRVRSPLRRPRLRHSRMVTLPILLGQSV